MLPAHPRDPRRLLRGLPWYEALPATEQDGIAAELLTLQAPRGATLLASGTPIGAWWGVQAGLVRLQTANSGGRVAAFLGVPEGEWFGEGSAIKGGSWPYDVIALRDSCLVGLPLARFQALQRDSLSFNRFLVERLNRRLGQAMAVIESGRLYTPEQRVAQYLSRLFWPGTRRLQLTQEEIGQLTGLSRQTVNRVLHDLAARGIVSPDLRRVAILDDAALDALLAAGPPASGPAAPPDGVC